MKFSHIKKKTFYDDDYSGQDDDIQEIDQGNDLENPIDSTIDSAFRVAKRKIKSACSEYFEYEK